MKTTRHHRKNKSHRGSNNKRNISFVSEVKHRAFHTLFEDMDTYEIAQCLNNIWIDPAFFMVVMPKHGDGEAYDRAFEREKKSLMA